MAASPELETALRAVVCELHGLLLDVGRHRHRPDAAHRARVFCRGTSAWPILPTTLEVFGSS